MIIFDASTLVGAAIGPDSVPRRAVQQARREDRLAMSAAVLAEVIEVMHRPRLARFIDPVLRDDVLELLMFGTAWFEPSIRVTDCRDAKDNKYLELALASATEMILSSDADLLVLDPWRGTRIVRPAEYLGSRVASG